MEEWCWGDEILGRGLEARTQGSGADGDGMGWAADYACVGRAFWPSGSVSGRDVWKVVAARN